MESWWPFDSMVPSSEQRAAFVGSIQEAGVRVALLNTFAGDMAAGDRGLGAVPGRGQEFRANFAAALSIAAEVGCPNVHVLLGNRGQSDPMDIESTSLEHLAWAAGEAAGGGRRVVIEVLNDLDTPDYVLTDLDRAIAWIEEVRARLGDEDAIGLLFDAYHLTRLGHDLTDAVDRAASVIAHVQVADVPGRGAPGTGTIEFERLVLALHRVGYRGPVSLEYSREADDSFDWLS
jgi:hydroxypyruvate isomerase